jgi:SAM-dependent methyltransferase
LATPCSTAWAYDHEGAGDLILARDHELRNQALFTRLAEAYVGRGERKWAREDIVWGIYKTPEEDLGVLRGIELRDKDVLELGCGTAFFLSWLARRGARAVGVDFTPAQIATALRLQKEYGVEFPIIEASAERVPLPDGSFDLVLSEYGASDFADPYLWIPEASRLLRPGGHLIVMKHSLLLLLCATSDGGVSHELQRPYRGLHRIEFPDEHEGVNFTLGFGDMLRLLRSEGLELEDYIEVYPPEDAEPKYEWAPPDWVRQWPLEEIWRMRKSNSL